jgi:hypothetical protein
LKTPRAWQRFLESATDDDKWVTTCSDLDNCEALVGDFARRVRDDIAATLDLCARDVADNPPIAACTDRFRRYLPAYLDQHGTSYGFRQDNHDYFAAQTGPDAPLGMMTPPPDLVAAVPNLGAIEEVARANGWPYLVHDSCLGGARIFVTTSDAELRFDQWMLFGLDEEGTLPTPAIMSFIAVQKEDAHGRKLDRVRLHFRDYLVTPTSGAPTLALPENFEGKCFACHGSGTRWLVPMHGSVAESTPVKGEPDYGRADVGADFGMARLDSLNQRLASYGLPDWNGTLEPADHGPPLGRSLGCTSCHDGVNRGALTVSTSEGMLRQKVVDQLGMRSTRGGQPVPDAAAMSLLDRERTANPPLSSDERAALDRARAEHQADYDAIVAERFPAWRAWVLERACE